MVNTISIALAGLQAASKKIEASASNIANVSTSGALDPADGPAPYSALTTQQQTVTDPNGNGIGVEAQNIPKDPGFVPAFDPNSPFANEDGVIGVPNVDLAEEAVNLKIAEASYKASLAALETAQELSDELFRAVDERA